MKAQVSLLTTGFAIFSMFFGAGNLIYPLEAGITSGNNSLFGMVGFLLTAVLLPFTGLIAITLFNGDYYAFFNRLKQPFGSLILFASLMVLGPLVAIPRIVTLSHTMTAPFLPIAFFQSITLYSSFVFSILFLSVTFLVTYRPRKIVEIIGNIITPALLASLGIIIIKGLMTAEHMIEATHSPFESFTTNFVRGYETLDLLGALFFSSILISMLKDKVLGENKLQKMASLCLKSGVIGIGLLSLIYVGMNLLGAFHGHETTALNTGELFSDLSFAILGSCGAGIIAAAVLLACLSTAMALSTTVAAYLQKVVFRDTIAYTTALIITLVASVPLSTYGLTTVLKLTGGPLVYVGYPVIIALTFCNILYKTVHFKPVTIPVLLTFFAALISYIW